MRVFQAKRTGRTLLLLAVLAAGCREKTARLDAPEIAVTNSYLACVVQDLCGEAMGVLCLAPPGMCPGHFDISPAQVRHLKGCKVLLRFDFQQGVEDRLARLRSAGLDVQQVQPAGGLCVPETYAGICRQVCRVLSRAYPERASEYETRLAAIESRLAGLAVELQGSVAAATVLTSNHQAGFAKWLGLDPVATFVGSDTETVASIDHCLKKAAGRDVRFVIANRQEGTALARALADRCGAKTVVFSNFPETCESGHGFDRLLRNNVSLLLEAAAK